MKTELTPGITPFSIKSALEPDGDNCSKRLKSKITGKPVIDSPFLFVNVCLSDNWAPGLVYVSWSNSTACWFISGSDDEFEHSCCSTVSTFSPFASAMM